MSINGSVVNTITLTSSTKFSEIRKEISKGRRVTLSIDGVKIQDKRTNLGKTIQQLGATACSIIDAEVHD